jgi:endonuclease-3
MSRFAKIIALLKYHYGAPAAPRAKGPFELVMWENACYLLPDERRLEVFEALREKVGLTAEDIFAASDRVLLPLARRGGMRPETRVMRWREIAAITLNQFDGDLNKILKLPYAQAKKALKQFPTVGDPGAEKILLLCGVASGLPLESNGLRVLSRLGWGRVQKDYGKTYRSVEEALKPELPARVDQLKEAHLLLRTHGKTLCKDAVPLCSQCPVAGECNYAQTTAALFLAPKNSVR